MDVTEIYWDGMNCINVAQDRDKWWYVMNMVLNLQVPQNVGSVTNQGTISCSRQQLYLTHDVTFLNLSQNKSIFDTY